MDQAYAGYPQLVHAHSATPETRLLRERRRFGVDHATLGAAALRKLGLPQELASTVAGHHEDGAAGAAGVVRLADALAHHHAGGMIALPAVTATAARIGVGRDVTRALLSDLPRGAAPRLGALECPLSSRELEVLKRLAEGAVYSEIASSLGVSPSTVRTHLGNVYRKLEVRDRAQAVLLAADQGWL
jgi:DNA-binding NarL/FixJ family response regulator